MVQDLHPVGASLVGDVADATVHDLLLLLLTADEINGVLALHLVCRQKLVAIFERSVRLCAVRADLSEATRVKHSWPTLLRVSKGLPLRVFVVSGRA